MWADSRTASSQRNLLGVCEGPPWFSQSVFPSLGYPTWQNEGQKLLLWQDSHDMHVITWILPFLKLKIHVLLAFYSIIYSVYFDIKFFFTKRFQVKGLQDVPCDSVLRALPGYHVFPSPWSTSAGSQSSRMDFRHIQVWNPSLPLSKPLHLLKPQFSHLSNRIVMRMKYMKCLGTGSGYINF